MAKLKTEPKLKLKTVLKKLPGPDEILWVTVEDGTEVEVETVRAALENQIREDDLDVGGVFVIASFAPEFSTMSFQELKTMRTQIDNWIRITEERRPQMSILPPDHIRGDEDAKR